MKVSDFYDLLERKGLSEYLMPEWEENEVFFLRDGGVGLAFECLPLWYINQNVENAFRLFLEDLPPSSSAQFIFTSTPDYLYMIDYYLANKRSKIGNLLSTPHGALGTHQHKPLEASKELLSTPHGALGTPQIATLTKIRHINHFVNRAPFSNEVNFPKSEIMQS